MVQKCTVQFDELDLKWAEISPVTCKQDAIELFKLGNTMLQKALKVYIVDGFVTEHLKITQTLSQLYKSLILIEEDRVRLYALYQRRIDLLTPLHEELNPNVYRNYL